MKLTRVEAGLYSVKLGQQTYVVANMAGQSIRWRGVVDTWVIKREGVEVARRRTLAEARGWLTAREGGS